ncbi:beta-induced protein ig-h3 [Seminavis robusta]|uniref:Beta-induced protein ig-h3 n=1 Tax=Seminavis robusta TaxID=568900 RepID=A0A9N8DR22_9STRA|nr:beta-induced protein ig-h3 [Seminavis robusta]|eukprot:Sro195_g083190.1 beta-induced protein ig-h3 (3308) ;mRNA; f:47184-57672
MKSTSATSPDTVGNSLRRGGSMGSIRRSRRRGMGSMGSIHMGMFLLVVTLLLGIHVVPCTGIWFTNEFNEKAGPCLSDSNVIGYKHIYDVMSDLEYEQIRLEAGEASRAPYVIPLCPRMRYLMEEQALEIILNEDITVACGELGQSSDQCVLEGGSGDYQLFIPPTYSRNVYVQGITFSQFPHSAIVARGDSDAVLYMKDTVFTNGTSVGSDIVDLAPPNDTALAAMSIAATRTTVQNHFGTPPGIFSNRQGSLYLEDLTLGDKGDSVVCDDHIVYTERANGYGSLNFRGTLEATGQTGNFGNYAPRIFVIRGTDGVEPGTHYFTDMNVVANQQLQFEVFLEIRGDKEQAIWTNVTVSNITMQADGVLVHAMNQSMVSISGGPSSSGGLTVEDSVNMGTILQASSLATVKASDVQVRRTTAKPDRIRVSSVLMASIGGTILAERFDVSDVRDFTSIYMAECGSVLQVLSACLSQATVEYIGFLDAESFPVMVENYVETGSISGLVQCAEEPSLSIFKPDPGSVCLGSTVPCTGTCLPTFRETTTCQPHDASLGLEFEATDSFDVRDCSASSAEQEDKILRFNLRFSIFSDTDFFELFKDDIDGVICQTQYWLSQLMQNATGSKSVYVQATEIDWGHYKEADEPLHLNFTAQLEDAASETDDVDWLDSQQILNEVERLGEEGWKRYLVDYVWKAEPLGQNVFANANQVFYDLLMREPVQGTLEEAECPATVAPTAAPSSSSSADSSSLDPSLTSVVDAVALYAEAETMLEKLVLSGVDSQLRTAGPFTLLVPTNEAFEKAYRPELDTEEYKHHLVDLLGYHVVEGLYVSSFITEDMKALTINGESINVTSIDPTMINGEATVIAADVLADNGVAHMIDELLLPRSFTMDMISAVTMHPDLTILLELLIPDLVETLQGTGPFTLFAPTDAAFRSLNPDVLMLLQTDEALREDVNALLSHHVANGIWVAGELQIESELQMLSGNTTMISNNPSLMIGSAQLRDTDILVTNGVIHIIDSVLLMGNATGSNSTGEDDDDSIGGPGGNINSSSPDWPFGPNYMDLSELDPMSDYNLSFSLFSGKESPASWADVNALMCQVNSFYTFHLRRMLNDATIFVKAVFIDFYFNDDGAGSDVEDIVVTFTAFAYFGDEEHTQVDADDVFQAMKLSADDLQNFREEFIWKSEPEQENIFYHTESLAIEAGVNNPINDNAMLVEASGCILPPEDEGAILSPNGPAVPDGGLGGDAKSTNIAVAFRVSNVENIKTSDDIKAAGLEDSFPVFVSELVNDMTAGSSALRGGRSLRVVPIPGTATIERVLEFDCPANVLPGLTCHEVLAAYDLLMSSDEDENTVNNEYTDATNLAVYDGTYNNVLQRVNPDTPLYIGIMTSEDQIPPGSDTAPGSGNNETEANVTSVVDILAGEEDFSALLAAMAATELDVFLEEMENVTLFAPQNAGFETLDMQRLTKLEYRPHLIDLLGYHVLPNEIPTDDLVLSFSMVALNGETVNVTSVSSRMLSELARPDTGGQDGIKLNYRATIVLADLEAENGVVHGLDSVLLPFSYRYDAMGAAFDLNYFSTLATLVSNADLLEMFQQPGPFTIFAPRNEALSSLSSDEYAELDSNPSALLEMLKGHVSTGVITSQDLYDGMVITMISGETHEVKLSPSPMIGSAQLRETDILVTNGVIHSIDNLARSPTSSESDETEPSADTVWDVIGGASNLQLFRSGLESTNVDKLLQQDTMDFTVFGPPDEAVQNDEALKFYSENLNSWIGHATDIFEHHIMVGLALTERGIWEDTVSEMFTTVTASCASSLLVNRRTQEIGGQSIVVADMSAANGVVHEMSGLLNVEWRRKSILQFLEEPYVTCMRTQGFLSRFRRLQDSFSFDNVIQALSSPSTQLDQSLSVGFAPNGSTFVAPSDVAFVDSGVPDDVDDVLLYHHVVDSNIYMEDLTSSFMGARKTAHPFADVLVTVDEWWTMRYNDVEVQEEYLAQNGVIHVINQLLVPPTMVEMLNFTTNFTDLKVSFLVDCFQSSSFDAANLATSLGYGPEQRFTLLAPLDGAFDAYFWGGEEKERFLSPLWSRHVDAVLLNLLIAQPYTKEDLDRELASEWSFILESLGGSIHTVYNRTNIGWGKSPNEAPSALDGVIHFVESLEFPASLTSDAVSLLWNFNNTSRFSELVFSGDLYDAISKVAPLTLLAPTDAAFDGRYTSAEIVSLLENHMFEAMLFKDQLKQMDGEYIVSLNGKKWWIETDGDSVSLRSADGPIVELGGGDHLFRTGVMHFVDSFIVEASDLPPTVSPTENPLGASGQNCSACDGDIVTTNSLPGGVSCSFWEYEVSQLDAASEECLLERAVGSTACGCVSTGSEEKCSLCADGDIDSSRVLPDAHGLTCGSLQGMDDVDGVACDILKEKYAAWCGCPDSKPPRCSFCQSGEHTAQPFPSITAVTMNYRLFGHLGAPDCDGFGNFYSVQTEDSCSDIDNVLYRDFPFDMRAWCRCTGETAPKACGEDFCPPGTELQESLVPGSEHGLNVTCQELSDLFPYVRDETVCDDARDTAKQCCLPASGPVGGEAAGGVNDTNPPMKLTTSFLAFDQEGQRTARDLAAPASVETVNTAFDKFMIDVVANTEATQRHLLQAPSNRRLAVSLVPGSSVLYGVSDVSCADYDGVPEKSSCQMVFAQYELILQDEDPKEVEKKYDEATQKAIEQGKLQQYLSQTDPNYPFKVAAVTDEPEASSDKMPWWVILFIVLASVFGVCGLCCIGGYFMSGPVRPKQNDDDIEAPLLEATAVHVTSDRVKPEQQEPSDGQDERTPTGEDSSVTPLDQNNLQREVVDDDYDEDVNRIARVEDQAGDDSSDEDGRDEPWGEDDGSWEDGDETYDEAHNVRLNKSEVAEVVSDEEDDLDDGDGQSWEHGDDDDEQQPRENPDLDQRDKEPNQDNEGEHQNRNAAFEVNDASQHGEELMQDEEAQAMDVVDDEEEHPAEEAQTMDEDKEEQPADADIGMVSEGSDHDSNIDGGMAETWDDEDVEQPTGEEGVVTPTDEQVGTSPDDEKEARSPTASPETEVFDANDSPRSDGNAVEELRAPAEPLPHMEQTAGEPAAVAVAQTNIDGAGEEPTGMPADTMIARVDSEDTDLDGFDEEGLGIAKLRSELAEIDRRAATSFASESLGPSSMIVEPDEEDVKLPASPRVNANSNKDSMQPDGDVNWVSLHEELAGDEAPQSIFDTFPAEEARQRELEAGESQPHESEEGGEQIPSNGGAGKQVSSFDTAGNPAHSSEGGDFDVLPNETENDFSSPTPQNEAVGTQVVADEDAIHA